MLVPLWVIAGCMIGLLVVGIRIGRKIERAILRLNQTPGMTPEDVAHVTDRLKQAATKMTDIGK